MFISFLRRLALPFREEGSRRGFARVKKNLLAFSSKFPQFFFFEALTIICGFLEASALGAWEHSQQHNHCCPQPASGGTSKKFLSGGVVEWMTRRHTPRPHSLHSTAVVKHWPHCPTAHPHDKLKFVTLTSEYHHQDSPAFSVMFTMLLRCSHTLSTATSSRSILSFFSPIATRHLLRAIFDSFCKQLVNVRK